MVLESRCRTEQKWYSASLCGMRIQREAGPAYFVHVRIGWKMSPWRARMIKMQVLRRASRVVNEEGSDQEVDVFS